MELSDGTSNRPFEVFGVASPAELARALDGEDYLADEGVATTIYLALALQRPILLEGDAGVGKTEVAKALATWLKVPLIRLQCYEGIDVSQAVYEWDYARQLLHIRTMEALGRAGSETSVSNVEDELFSERFLVRRPLLQALDEKNLTIRDGESIPPVLLIDEIDRADDEFEAYLLEILSEGSVTVPELGAITAKKNPITVITSNRTRDVHDALKRRCLYHWVDHPTFDREVAIIKRRAPYVEDKLIAQVAKVAEAVREAGVYKPPGIAEAIDWAKSLSILGSKELDVENLSMSLGALIKYKEDEEKVKSMDLTTIIRSALEGV